MPDVEELTAPDAPMPNADQVAESVNLLLPAGEIVGLADWRACYANDVWVFDTTLGRVVAKVRRFAEEDPRQIEDQRRAQAILVAAGFPTPGLIALEASFPLLGGRQVSVLEFVDGLPGEQAINSMGNTERDRLFVDLGRWTGVLHQLNIESFGGWVDDDGREHDTWGHVLCAIADRALRDLDSYAAPLPSAQARELERRVNAFVDICTEPTPSLVHRDLHLGNVMVSEGILTSILDFEMVREWDAAWELPKCKDVVFQKYEGSEDLFMEGYFASRSDLPADLSTRVWCYAGLRYLTCMVDHLEGNPIYADAGQQFADWITDNSPI